MLRLAVAAPVAAEDVAHDASRYEFRDLGRGDNGRAADDDGLYGWWPDHRQRVRPDGWQLSAVVQRTPTLAAEIVADGACSVAAAARGRFGRGEAFLVHGGQL